MRYIDFKNSILEELRRNSGGLTWAELKERLNLPYTSPCQTWINRMEQEDGLRRVKSSGRAYLWKVLPK
jgi:hypothetical protein